MYKLIKYNVNSSGYFLLLFLIISFPSFSQDNQIPVDGLYESGPIAKMVSSSGTVLEEIQTIYQRINIDGTRVTMVSDLNNNGVIEQKEIKDRTTFSGSHSNNMLVWYGLNRTTLLAFFYLPQSNSYYLIMFGEEKNDNRLMIQFTLIKQW